MSIELFINHEILIVWPAMAITVFEGGAIVVEFSWLMGRLWLTFGSIE